ncbi:WD40-repeat-containing domain protein [Myxozyma melibiosi]|uniref:WD40-repeat-containing domain protein n=1 Tax=Myxozyma melibiosi TaxID=54550 RepID=A0ABR1F4P2_9ASCO
MAQPQHVVPKYAHTPGLTRVAYSADGRYLISVGANRLIRKFLVDSPDDEPINTEYHEKDITGIATSKTHFATCSEDGTASLFAVETSEVENMLMRQSMPFRDVTFSNDGQWIALAGDDTTVKLVNTKDITRTLSLTGHRQGVKHVSFHPNGALVTTASFDGTLRVFSISSEEPELVKTFDGLAASIKDELDEASIKVAWHPDGRVFATQNKTRDVITINRSTWEPERSFANGHMGAINDYAWSPNGAYLATAGSDAKILIWDTKSQNIVNKFNYRNIICVVWHPTKNEISFTSNMGQLYTIPGVVPEKLDMPFGKSIYPAPLINDPDAGGAVSSVKPGARGPIAMVPDEFDDDISNVDDLEEVQREWIEDDDGAGYIPDLVPDTDSFSDSPRKRPYGLASDDLASNKRRFVTVMKGMQHEAFQPGSTPFINQRRYLAMTSIGYIWTVDQYEYNTVTVNFFDREKHREYHFTDHFRYDKACLTDDAALFAANDEDRAGSRLFFRSHGGLTDSWDLSFPNETIASIALSKTSVVVCSSKGYVRVFNLHGSPLRLYRQSSNPVVCCASHDDFLMVVRNQGDGSGKLMYTLENVKHDETLQKNDVVDIPYGATLRSLFFSEEGDPCIFDSEGVLLILMHWRQPLQAKWVPLLDTQAMGRDNPDESFWPLGVFENKFNCIILKGGEKNPSIPLPISSEIEIKLPVYSALSTKSSEHDSAQQKDATDSMKLEERYLQESVLLQLYKDGVLASCGGDESLMDDDQRDELSRRELAIDKLVLQLLQVLCRRGGYDGKAYGLVKMIHKDNALRAASKIALRYEMTSLAEKINREIEKRLEEEE